MGITEKDLAILEEIQTRALWLTVRMIDYANHDRPNIDGIKVGGHQASSASMISILTSLYFYHLDANDRVSVKPHASPVFHSIKYLLGNLDKKYLTSLRSAGGLQSYHHEPKIRILSIFPQVLLASVLLPRSLPELLVAMLMLISVRDQLHVLSHSSEMPN